MDAAQTKPTIEVLLATRNGAPYLPQQIASLFQQDYENIRVLARDDGSTDATEAVLQAAAAQHPERFQIVQSTTPTGSAAGNFRQLLLARCAEYVAFCDQDDVWLPSKLSSSMQAMRSLEQKHGTAMPLIVFSDLEVVDANLGKVHDSLWRNNGLDPSTVASLPRLLSENVVTGCTVLMNRSMADLAKRMPAAGKASAAMHDHWLALLAATLGKAAWLPEATVLYRQHDANVIGAAREDGSLSGRLLRLFGRTAYRKRCENRALLQRQAALFLGTYKEELSANDRQTLLAYITFAQHGWPRQIQSMLRHGLWRGTAARNLTTLLDLFRS